MSDEERELRRCLALLNKHNIKLPSYEALLWDLDAARKQVAEDTVRIRDEALEDAAQLADKAGWGDALANEIRDLKVNR